jgi:hypothetical protein
MICPDTADDWGFTKAAIRRLVEIGLKAKSER